MSHYGAYVKVWSGEGDEAMTACTTRYKQMKVGFMKVKSRVSNWVMDRPREEVVDPTVQIQTELQSTAYSRQRIELEVQVMEQYFSALPGDLSGETVSNERVKPDHLAATLETRLWPHLQKQIDLEPLRRNDLQSDHLAFIASQEAKISLALGNLFKKQAKVHRTLLQVSQSDRHLDSS